MMAFGFESLRRGTSLAKDVIVSVSTWITLAVGSKSIEDSVPSRFAIGLIR